jgi:hypothetical protein
MSLVLAHEGFRTLSFGFSIFAAIDLIYFDENILIK